MFNRRKPDEPKPETTQAPEPPAQPDFLAPTPSQDEDDQLSVPPFRPATPASSPFQIAALKESPMARSPFAPPLPPTPTASPMRPVNNGAPTTYANEPRDTRERRTLVVGRGISVQGTVQDAERLVVEGTMEATMVNGLSELFIPHGGVFKGEVEVDEAEIAGTIDGTVTARNALIVRSSGRVLGTARCRRLQVEDGGQITGRIEMLANTPTAPEAE